MGGAWASLGGGWVGVGVAVRERRGQDEEHAIGNRLVSVVFRFEFEELAGQSESDPRSDPVRWRSAGQSRAR